MVPEELENKLMEWQETGEYPEIDLDKFVDFYSAYPLFTLAPCIIKNSKKIAIDKIYGSNWAFQNKQNRGNYPCSNKLNSLFYEYTKRNKKPMYRRQIPPVPIVKIFDKYFLDEGNHRLYICKLLNRKFILADVAEYNYKYFLDHSCLDFFRNIPYIIYENKMYHIDDDSKINYLKLKTKHP